MSVCWSWPKPERSRYTAMPELKAAVVGAGRLGALHAAKYAAIPGVKLSHVVDIDLERAAHVAKLCGAVRVD